MVVTHRSRVHYVPLHNTVKDIHIYLPVLQFGLSLYFSDTPMRTQDASSTAKAIASNVEPPICSTSIHTL